MEKVDPPMGGKPYLLEGSVVELWEEMKCYISFSDEDVFDGMALLEEIHVVTAEEATIKSTMPTLADPPAADVTLGLTEEKRPLNKFPGWEKVLCPSRPIVATGQIPPPSRSPR